MTFTFTDIHVPIDADYNIVYANVLIHTYVLSKLSKGRGRRGLQLRRIAADMIADAHVVIDGDVAHGRTANRSVRGGMWGVPLATARRGAYFALE